MTIEGREQAEFENKPPLPTEVIDRLEGFPRFFGEVVIEQHDPNKVKKVFVIGPAGVGKSTISSQLVIKMQESHELKSKAKESGKRLFVWHYPFDHALRELMSGPMQMITTSWGGFSTKDFELASVHMSETIAGMEIRIPIDHPSRDTSMIVDLVGLTEQRGAMVINTQFDINSSLLVVLPDKSGEVLRRSKEIRAALHNKKNSKEVFIDKLREFRVIADLPVTTPQFQRLKTMMGNETSVDRVNKQLADIVVELKQVLMEKEYPDLFGRKCPDFDRETFLNDPSVMSDVLDFYSRYLVFEKWRIPQEKVLITHNSVLNSDINYYLSVLESVDLIKR